MGDDAGAGEVAPRGSVVAVNAATGAIQWKTYAVPTGYYGGGVWGSNPVVDPGRNTVFVGTGNNSLTPTDPTYLSCISGGGTQETCNAPDNFEDAIVALDMGTGQVKWANKLVYWNQQYLNIKNGSDDWNVDCIWPTFGIPYPPYNSPGPQCPANTGPDYDFASAPNLITYKPAQGPPKTILGAGQKSGIYYALDPDTGQLLWQTQVGPGSTLGGMEWGSASDGQRIYVSIANLYGIPSGNNFGGSWSALDPATGKIIWQTFDPNNAINLGPMSVANGVVYASSMAGGPAAPTMFALNAATGQIAWSFAAGSSVNAGATIVGSTVLWGSGYSHLGIVGQTPNTKFYAFSPGGR
jgi:polyvinyl alcohol dehydrogenase (cytochrome)